MMQPARINYLDRKPGPATKPATQDKPDKGSMIKDTKFGSESASRGNIARGQSQMARKCEEGIKGQTKMTKFGIH